MKAGDIITSSRDDLDDLETPPNWSDTKLLRFLLQGQQQACMRAELIWDASSGMCGVSVAAGDIDVAIDSRITRIKWAGWDNGTTVEPLEIIDQRTADSRSARWRQYTGTPRAIVPMPNAVRVFYPPAEAGTLRLEVYRQPLATTLTMTSNLEIPDRWAPLLVHWVLYRAYQTRDADKGSKALSDKALAEFGRYFGDLPSVYSQASRAQQRDTTIEPRGF